MGFGYIGYFYSVGDRHIFRWESSTFYNEPAHMDSNQSVRNMDNHVHQIKVKKSLNIIIYLLNFCAFYRKVGINVIKKQHNDEKKED